MKLEFGAHTTFNGVQVTVLKHRVNVWRCRLQARWRNPTGMIGPHAGLLSASGKCRRNFERGAENCPTRQITFACRILSSPVAKNISLPFSPKSPAH
jgi:hypothetical protein